jgi:hypothetical protein
MLRITHGNNMATAIIKTRPVWRLPELFPERETASQILLEQMPAEGVSQEKS